MPDSLSSSARSFDDASCRASQIPQTSLSVRRPHFDSSPQEMFGIAGSKSESEAMPRDTSVWTGLFVTEHTIQQGAMPEAPPWPPYLPVPVDQMVARQSLSQSVCTVSLAIDTRPEFRCERRGLEACLECIHWSATRWARRPDTCRPRARECACAPSFLGSCNMPGGHARTQHPLRPRPGRRLRTRTRHGVECSSIRVACGRLRWLSCLQDPMAR